MSNIKLDRVAVFAASALFIGLSAGKRRVLVEFVKARVMQSG